MTEDTSKFIGNCSTEIDWITITTNLRNKSGKDLTPNRSVWNTNNSNYDELFDMWEAANFNLTSFKWTNYYPDKDYDKNIIPVFEKIVNAKHIRSWISRIDPGYCTPWHWDTDDNETEYLKLGQLRRFSCHIEEPAVGQVFLIGKESHYFWTAGDIYQWSSHRAWHAGVNVGLTPKFLFNFLGYV